MSKQQEPSDVFRISKGAQPNFFQDPAIDALYSMVVILTEEIAVLRDRLDTHERLAEVGETSKVDNVEAFAADVDLEKIRDEARWHLIRRVMRPLKQLQYASVTKAQKKFETDVTTIID
jgi:hypothetical protein